MRTFLIVVLIMLLAPLAVAATIQLPKTGQTVSYSIADDGALQRGVAWPVPRFTDNNNGTVTDNLTGLIWLKNANCFGSVTWTDALANAKNLASGACGLTDGSNVGDWRLPNKNEIMSLITRKQTSSAAWLGTSGLSNVQADGYWSSSTEGNYTSSAWFVLMQYGYVSYDPKGNSYYAWPVRGGQFGNPVISVLPAARDFGSVTPGSSASQIVTISNTAGGGSSKLQVNSVALSGADAGQFGISAGDGTGGTCGSLTPIIPAGSSCAVTVTFSPASAAAKTANLRISSNDVNLPDIDLPLSGNGFSISATVSGGNGTVSSSNPVYVSSGSAASFTLARSAGYLPNSNVTGTCPAGSFNGSVYTSGAITGTCSVGFSFVPGYFPLAIALNGTGTGAIGVQPSPPGVDCTGNCSQSFPVDSVVTLTPTAGSNSLFSSWSGCDSVTGNRCAVTMTGSKNVSATFNYITYPLSITYAGPAGGTVAIQSSPPGGSCSGSCSKLVNIGTTATLTSVGGSNIKFVSWSGCDSVTDNLCMVTMTGAKNVAASFTYIEPAPTVTSHVPINGAQVPVSSAVQATFSESLNPASLTSGTFTLSGFAGAKAISAGGYHTLTLKKDGTVVAWGGNWGGQATVPQGLTGVVAIAAGYEHSVALKEDGTVVAWGKNDDGQTSVPAGLSGVVAIAAGSWHTVALKNDGTVVAWGRNYYRQCSLPGGLSGVVAIAAGSQQTVVLKKDGTVAAWGEMVFPTPAGLSGVIAIAAGRWHIAALKNDGTLVVWGESSWGQTRVPTGLSGVTAIAAGDYYTLALKNDGTVVAWGTGLSAPPDVGITAISAGECHGVGMKSDGTVVAWGSNTFGQTTVRPEFVGSGVAVSGTLAYDPATYTATFVPSAPLAANNLFTVTLTGIRSAGGTPLAAPVTWNFTTAIDRDPPVTTASVDCLHGSYGWCRSDATVTLTATDAASGVARTEYRIGTGVWTQYAVPFTVTSNGAASISFRSTDVGGNTEQDKIYNLAIDKSSPTTVASLAGIYGGNGRYISDVQVTLVASDYVSGVARTEYSLDGVTWSSYAGPFTISAEGTTVFSYRSLDNAGGLEPANAMTVVIDKAGVNSSITSPANGEMILTPSYTITGTASSGVGVQRVEVAIDGVWHTANGTNAWSYAWSPATTGQHTIQSRATANSGAVETLKQSITVTVAANLPWVTKTSLPLAVSRAVSGAVNDKIYVLGGIKGGGTTDAVQVYNPTDNAWQVQSPLCAPVFAAAGATLGDTIYVAGGNGDAWGVKDNIFAYNTATTSGSCSNIGYLTIPRFRMNGAILNGNLYVVGGIGNTGAVLDSIEEFSLASGNHASRLMSIPLPEGRTLAAVVAVGTKLYIMGGSNSNGPTNTCWEYDPTNTVQPFVLKSSLPVAVEAREAVQANGKIYIVGGWTQSGITQAVQEYDIATNAWHIVGYVPTSRYAHVAEVISGNLYVMGGDNGMGGSVGVNEAAAISGVWTVYSIGTAPVPYPQTPQYAIDWLAAVHPPVSQGNYVKIGGSYYYALGTAGISGSWNGPTYNATALQQCNQVSGEPLYDGSGNPLLADMAGSVGKTITLYAMWPLQTSWTVHSVGVPPLPYPQSPNYAIDWSAFQHTSLTPGNWLKIGSAFYYVLGSDPNYPGSWNGLGYNATALQQCNQTTGASLYDFAGNYQLADMSGTEGQPITLYTTWPLITQTGPVSAITSPVDGAVVNNSVYTIIGTASAGGGAPLQRVEVSTDCGSTWTTATGTSQWNYAWTAANGQYCIKSRAVNSAAVTENPGAGITVAVVNMPHSSIGTPLTGTVLTGYSATITGTASSASGVRLIEVSTDGSNWYPATDTSGGSWGTWGYSWTLPSNGQYTIQSRATGSTGIIESPGVGIKVTVANVEPPSMSFSVSYGRNMPTARVGAVSAVVNGLIFVMGGSNVLEPPPAGSLSTVEMYNPLTDSWQTRTPLGVPRFAAGSVVVGDTVYITGGTAVGGPGYGGPNQTNTVLSYNTTTGTTSTVGSLNTARFRTDAALMNSKIYVFGGSGQGGALSSVEEFDLASKKVTNNSNMPAPRDLPAVVAYGAKIYVMGGFDASGAPMSTCWEYDPSLHTIALKSPMPVPRGGRGAIVLGGKIYLLAGAVSPGPPPIDMTSSIQEYDPTTDRWQVVGSVPDLRWGLVAEYANSALYVIGGGNNQQLLGLNEIVTPVVAAPFTSASPAGGIYNMARTVTLSANQSANTYYTTNGTTPTTASTRYTVPINISANSTLKFFSVGGTGSAEAVKTEIYMIDTVPPVGSVAINNGAQLTASTTVILTLSATDASGVLQMQFSNDGVNWSLPESYTTAKTWSLTSGDGPKTVYVKFCDTAGNWSSGVSASILLDGSNSFLPVVNYDTWADTRSIVAGDFNGDGITDLALGNTDTGTVSIMLGSGSGVFLPKVDYQAGAGPVAIAVGDFNGNGKLDLVVVNRDDRTVSILSGNGDGTLRPKMDFPVGIAPYGVVVGDFDGDGRLDLAVANYGSNTVSLLLGNGDGTFKPKSDYGTGRFPISMAVGDFNSDGKLDLAVTNSTDNTVSILLGNGDGTFQPRADYSVGSSPGSIATGDFNGDGKPDLAVANYGSNTVSVLLGNGSGTFMSKSDYSTGRFPSSVTIGDFNGDGRLDLAVANATDNSVSILLGKGDGTFQLKMDFSTGAAPAAVIVGDFNKDGKADLAVADSGGYWHSGQVSILWSNTPVRIASIPLVRFDSLQAAYDSLTITDTIQSHALAFSGDLLLNKDVVVSIKGGYDSSYSVNSMQTTINGVMRVRNGTVKVENLCFR